MPDMPVAARANSLRRLNELRLELAAVRGQLEATRRPLNRDNALELVAMADELARHLVNTLTTCAENHVTRG